MDHSEVKHLPKIDHTPAELDEPSRLLLKAAALIEERGHHKGSYSASNGMVCFRGALNIAACGDPVGIPNAPGADEASIRFLQTLRREGWGLGWLEWNDAPDRTRDEVVAKMRAVALGL